MKRRWLWPLLAIAVASPARADYDVLGRFLYRDRSFGTGGFTGSDTDKPIRLADVQVVDGTDAVLATGATDQSGSFTLHVVDNQVRNLRVRVLCRADNTPSFKARVLQTGPSAVFAVVSPTYSNHPSNQNIDFTASPVVALQNQGGEAFNIFDQVLDAFDFVASLHGSRPSRQLTLYWSSIPPYSEDGTYYRDWDASIHLFGKSDDSDGYDDTVILHELGHYTEYNFSASDSPGGPHSLSEYFDLTLTWSEGWGTFFANMVRNWRGIARPDIYVDTAGQPGPGQAFISYQVETPSAGRPGANNEVSVNAALWDIVDTPATADASPGIDDDPLSLADGPAEFWTVFTQYIPTAASISLEDFWDGWFSPSIANGHLAEMRQTFAARSIEYSPDAFESDAGTALARTVVASGALTHHTIYGVGDEDWSVIGVVGQTPYTFETTNLKSAADTRLDLFAANGTTLLASNDDRLPADPSSSIGYTPPASGLVYLRCKRKADAHTYGSYDLVVTGQPVAVVVSDVRIEAGSAGILLRWQARREGTFSHFEIERGASTTGPWATAVKVPVAAGSGAIAAYEWLDGSVAAGNRYFYRIVGVEATGERRAFGPYEATAAPAARLALHAPAPNPFNPSTAIAFELPRASRTWLRAFATDGRFVRTLVAGEMLPAGPHTAHWDGRDAAGHPVASGIYLLVLDAGGERRLQRAALVR